MMSVWKYEKISEMFVRNCMKLLNIPIKVTFYTFLGRLLIFWGDIFCKYSLDLETNGWMKSSLFLWSIGGWFYDSSNKYAWNHIIDSRKYSTDPTKKYNE